MKGIGLVDIETRSLTKPIVGSISKDSLKGSSDDGISHWLKEFFTIRIAGQREGDLQQKQRKSPA